MITIDAHRCPQNHRCPAVHVCRFGAISQQGSGLPQVDQEKCSNCMTCVDFCPTRAIKAS